MNTESFPLLRLPFCVLDIVCKKLSTREIFDLSLCSKKARLVAKQFRDKSRVLFIQGTYCSFGEIVIGEGDQDIQSPWDELESLFELHSADEIPEDHQILKLNSETIPYTIGEGGELITYWPDLFHGIKFLLEYTIDFLECKLTEITVGNNLEPNQPRLFIDWVLGRQDGIHWCSVAYRNNVDEELKYYLDTCKPIQWNYIDATPSDRFQHTFTFDSERVHLQHGYWLSLDNLLSMNCKYLYAQSSRITSQEMNVFVTSWMNGGLPNFKAMRFVMNELAIGVVTAGMTALEVFHEEEKIYDAREDDPIEVSHSYQLRRNDGVIASIIHDAYNDLDYVFVFLVWPDFKGRQYEPNIVVPVE